MSAQTRLRGLIDAFERRYKIYTPEMTSLRLDADVLFDKNRLVLFLAMLNLQTAYGSDPIHVHSQDIATSLETVEKENREITAVIRELLRALDDEKAVVWAAMDLLPVRDKQKLNSSRPAVALPVEILAHIFLFACIDAIYPTKPRLIRSAIAATCHHWRVSAIGTPALWSQMFLGISKRPSSTSVVSPGSDHVVLRPHTSLVDLELERASSWPLNLTISISYLFDSALRISAPDIFTIRAALSRSEVVKVSAANSGLLVSIFSPTLPFPSLTSFTINRDIISSGKLTVDLCQAPLLHDVRARGPVALALPSTSHSPLHTFFGEHRLDLSELLQVANCRNLKHLSFEGMRSSAVEPPAVLEFPALERLQHHPKPFALQIIEAIVAPHLKYLSLGWRSDLPTTDQFPALRCLEATAGVRLLDGLGRFPRLEEILILSSSHTSDLKEILDVLVQRSGEAEAGLLPHLRKLKCEYTPDVAEAIASLIESRNDEERTRRGLRFTVGLHLRTSHDEKSLVEFLGLHPLAVRESGAKLFFDDFLPSKRFFAW